MNRNDQPSTPIKDQTARRSTRSAATEVRPPAKLADVDATKWPQWYPNSKDVRITGGGDELTAGSVFRWTTFGLPLESRINEFTPYSRIGWYGYSPGEQPSFYHTWYLEAEGEGCLVVTDEVGMGSSAAHLREADEGLMHRGHDLWLATLKWMAEGN